MLGGKAAETKGERGGQRVEFPVDHCQASRSQYKYLNASPALLLALLLARCNLSVPFVSPSRARGTGTIWIFHSWNVLCALLLLLLLLQAKKEKRFIVDGKLIMDLNRFVTKDEEKLMRMSLYNQFDLLIILSFYILYTKGLSIKISVYPYLMFPLKIRYSISGTFKFKKKSGGILAKIDIRIINIH